MENMKSFFPLSINTTYRIGGHFYLPQNESWMADTHVFDQNIFYYILSGHCTITIDGKEYTGRKGQWFFIPSGAQYSYHNSTDEPFEKYWFHFDLYPGNDWVNSLHLEPCIDASGDAEIENLFKDFALICKSNELHDRIRVNAIILTILSEYIKRAGEISMSLVEAHRNDLYEVLNYINENIDKSLTNSELADYMHMHPNHFIRYFKREMGETPQRYIMLRRIESAKRMLEETTLSISAISELTGLCDSAHLSKLFKKVYAISPSQYRKGNINNNSFYLDR